MSALPPFNLESLDCPTTPVLWFRDSARTNPPHAPFAAGQIGAPATRLAIFSGAFNPLHDGHLEIARLATELLGVEVHFEISIRNVDKPELSTHEVANRLASFPAHSHIAITRAMKFTAKSALFPGAIFVVGADTIRRIADPKYTDGSHRRMLDSIDLFSQAGCRFLVFGRFFGDTFQQLDRESHEKVVLDGVVIPQSLLAICQTVDESQFRCDISSTQLRQNRSRGSI